MPDIEIKKLTGEDIELFLELVKVFEEVFGWDRPGPNQSNLEKVLNREQFMVFVAIIDNRVVAGLTAYVLERYDVEKPSAYIYDIAVVEYMQRKGIGKKLIETFTAYCAKNEFSEVFVQAEQEDQHAVDFYRKTDASSEMMAIHFTYDLSRKEA